MRTTTKRSRLSRWWSGMKPWAGPFIGCEIVQKFTQRKQSLGVVSTYNPVCDACVEKRLHSDSEYKVYHPFAGHGHSRAHGTPKSA